MSDTAYNGESKPQSRELTAKERDILYRVLGDVIYAQSYEIPAVRLFAGDRFVLMDIRDAIDPREN